MKCKNCIFKIKSDCRRLPPQLIWCVEDINAGYFSSDWPEVSDNDWCGEFKEKKPDISSSIEHDNS